MKTERQFFRMLTDVFGKTAASHRLIFLTKWEVVRCAQFLFTILFQWNFVSRKNPESCGVRILHIHSLTTFWDHGAESWQRNYNSIHWSSIPSCSIYMQPKLLKRKRFESRHKKIWNRPTVPCAVATGLKSSLHNEFLCLKIPHTCHWCGITFSSSANFEKTKLAPTREENLSTLRSLPISWAKILRFHEKGFLQE